MAQEYLYVLLYRCKKCDRPITSTIAFDNADVTESSARQQASQSEVWCEGPDCEWHGLAGDLKYVRMHVGTWMRA
jgi:hypothetical protein